MMDDLISRQAAIDFIDAGRLCNPNEPRWSDNEIVNFLKSRPSAQRTGRWIWDVYDVLGADAYKCSSCGYHAYGNTSEIMLGDFKFCPNCGAEMRGEQDE